MFEEEEAIMQDQHLQPNEYSDDLNSYMQINNS